MENMSIKFDAKDNLLSIKMIFMLGFVFLSHNNVQAGRNLPTSFVYSEHSSVWFYWNFHTTGTISKQKWFVEDTITSSINLLAEANGKNHQEGIMKVSNSLPSSMIGRVAAISNNRTLIISNLQLNDTLRKFYTVFYIYSVGTQVYARQLDKFQLTVNAAPKYVKAISPRVKVVENGELLVDLLFIGNPRPSVEFQWSGSTTKSAMTVTNAYPMVYNATFSYKPVSASLCGKNFRITAKNSIGNAVTTSSISTLFDYGNQDVIAEKIGRSCIEVTWQKKEPRGACNILYNVHFQDKNGSTVRTSLEVNKGKSIECGFSVNITHIKLLMLSWSQSTFSANVTELPDPVVSKEQFSSPQDIIALAKSKTWLHWNYTFRTVNGVYQFIRQQWIFVDSATKNTHIIAEKNGISGLMKVASSLPSSVIGRIAAFSYNDTLVISDLKYEDSYRLFQSRVIVQAAKVSRLFTYSLNPGVQITVKGAPSYVIAPQTSYQARENGELSFEFYVHANPKPTINLKWSHWHTAIVLNMTKETSYSYKIAYSLKPVLSSYCGRSFIVTAENSLGKAADITSMINLELNYDDPELQARKLNKTCIELNWKTKDLGACKEFYNINFMNSAGKVIYSEYYESTSTYNGVQKCEIPTRTNITTVEIFMGPTKSFTAYVAEPVYPLTTQPTTEATTTEQTTEKEVKTTKETNKVTKQAKKNKQVSEKESNESLIMLHVQYVVVTVILIVILVVLLIWNRKLRKAKLHGGEKILNPNYDRPSVEMGDVKAINYMELGPRENVKESIYAGLSNAAYETAEPVKYVNVSTK